MIFASVKKTYSLGKRLCRLPPARRTLLLHTLVVVLVMRAGLQFWSLRTILRFLQRVTMAKSRRTRYEINDISEALTTVGRRLSLATCLVNGLAGQYLLGRNGYTATLHIGVKKEADTSLTAHAWVTVDQEVVIGMIDDLHTYTMLPDIS